MGKAMSTLAVLTALACGAAPARALGLEYRLRVDAGSGNTVIYRSDDTFKTYPGWGGAFEVSVPLSRRFEAGAEYSWNSWVMHSSDPRALSRWLDDRALGLTLRLVPAGPSGRFVPYVGAGVAAVGYEYTQWDWAENTVVRLAGAKGHVPGFHCLVGLRLSPVRRVALVAEWRRRWAEADEEPLLAHGELGTGRGLGGSSFTAGVHFRVR